MPRKKLEWTPQQIEEFKRLCGIFCTEEEICFVLGVNSDQLLKLVNKHLREEVCGKATQKITFEEAFEKFSTNGKISLRRKQMELALAGDKSMLIWLGKQQLGQTDPDKGKTAKVQGEQRTIPSAQNIQSFRTLSPVAKAAGM